MVFFNSNASSSPLLKVSSGIKCSCSHCSLLTNFRLGLNFCSIGCHLTCSLRGFMTPDELPKQSVIWLSDDRVDFWHIGNFGRLSWTLSSSTVQFLSTLRKRPFLLELSMDKTDGGHHASLQCELPRCGRSAEPCEQKSRRFWPCRKAR